MDNTNSRNPLYTIAAIAVILFSGVGVATMMGWIPNSLSKNTENTAAPAGLMAPAGSAAAGAAAGAASGQGQAPQGAMAQAPGEAAPPAPQHHHQQAHRVAEGGMPPPGEAGMPPPGMPGAPQQAAPAPVCANCGTVQSVQQVEHRGEGTGLGAVAGGVLGAVVGHQVGQGNGNTLATLIGAGGGALAGNTVEKNVRKSVSWKVNVQMADGSLRTFNFANQPGFGPGEPVRVSNGQLMAAGN